MKPEDIKTGGASATIYRDAPRWKDLRTAAIGRFKSDSADQGAALLNTCASRLQAEGYEALIGPMDGDTWHSYRLVSFSNGQPPFMLEPTSKPHDMPAFEHAGFSQISAYVSSLAPLPAALASVPEPVPGISIIPWDGKDADRLFGDVFDLSTKAFSKNAFYKPIDRKAFLDIYRPVQPMLVRELILFARDEDQNLAGFLFGIPNYAMGPKPANVILKTYASAHRGVGHLLTHAFHSAAHRLGYQAAIHALIHEDNISADRSGRHGAEVFRRYALMGRVLA